jgi:hypothetical protein
MRRQGFDWYGVLYASTVGISCVFIGAARIGRVEGRHTLLSAEGRKIVREAACRMLGWPTEDERTKPPAGWVYPGGNPGGRRYPAGGGRYFPAGH